MIKHFQRILATILLFTIALTLFAAYGKEGLKDYVTFAPGYEPTALSYERYVQGIAHRMANELLLALPFLAVTVTALLLGRDYGDGFYEIEKAASRGKALSRPCWQPFLV